MGNCTVREPPLEAGASWVMPLPLVKVAGHEEEGVSQRSCWEVHVKVMDPPTGMVSDEDWPLAGTTQLTVLVSVADAKLMSVCWTGSALVSWGRVRKARPRTTLVQEQPCAQSRAVRDNVEQERNG